MKKILKTHSIVKYLLILLAGVFIWFATFNHMNSKVKRLTYNIEELGTQNSDLRFTESELRSYISTKNTEHKREMDSVLKKLSVKPKNIIRYQKVFVHIMDSDTVVITSNESKIQNDSLYRKEINYAKNCLKMDGYVLTKDSSTQAFITNIESSNRIYITKSYKKSFWDVIFFRKGKEIIKTTSDCGEVNSDEINIQ